MEAKIEPAWKSDKLDSFLISRFGYGLLEFEVSFLYTFIKLRFFNLRARSWPFIRKEIDQLRDIKEKILKILDGYLSSIDFYKESSKYDEMRKIGVEAWTPEKWRIFILNRYQLEPLFKMIEMQIDWLIGRSTLDELDPLAYGIEKSIRIKPAYFIILVWSHAFKKGKKIDWANMERLFLWMKYNYGDIELCQFYESRGLDENFPELARQKLNRYIDKNPGKLASFQFRAVFKNTDKTQYKKILERLKGFLGLGFVRTAEEYSKACARVFARAILFPEKFSTLYPQLSLESILPAEEESEKIRISKRSRSTRKPVRKHLDLA